MPTLETPARILDAGEALFAEGGYVGTSVRQLSAAAGVDLGAIRYHFGSKAGLFEALVRRRLVPLGETRVAALAALGPDPSVEAILEAFVRPVLELMTHPRHGVAWRRLIGWAQLEQNAFADVDREMAEEQFLPYLDALARALPGVRREELVYRFYFLLGAEIVALTGTNHLAALSPDAPTLDDDPEGMLRRLVAFLAAGLRAPAP